MSRFVKFSVVSVRDLLVTYGPVLILVVLIVWAAYVAVDPTPPSRVVISTGPDNGAYDNFAKRYKAILARHHIELEFRPSHGSRENLKRLKDSNSGVDVGFVQSGSTNASAEASVENNAEQVADSSGLVSLGSLFVEPVWLFYRETSKPGADSADSPQATERKKIREGSAQPASRLIARLSDLRGLKVNLGARGSGAPRIASQLMQANRIEPKDLTISNLENTPAVVALFEGKLDAVLFSSAEDDPLIQMLLQTPGVRLFNFEQAEAYARRFPFVSHVVLTRGIVALERDLPPADVHLIAPTATLVARAGTHPAIKELLVQAAVEVHGGSGWFRRAREFPTAEYSEIPVAREAERYYKSGPPLLQRYLPFWLANLIDRMWVIIVPVIALFLPLSRVLPPLYAWRVRSRVYRWYGQLRKIEEEIEHEMQSPGEHDFAAQLKRLDQLDEGLNRVVIPLAYADELYSLRGHIDMVRKKALQRIAESQSAAQSAEPSDADHGSGLDPSIEAQPAA